MHESQPIVTVAPIELDDVPPLVNVPVALPVATPVQKTKAPQPGTEDDYLELARQRGLIVDRTPPPRPKWLFFSGVFGYPWRGVNLTRWVVMSVALCVLGFVGVEALSATGILKGRGENPILAIFLIMFTVLISVVTLSYASAVCQEIIQVTADGHDLPSDNGLDDWAMYFYALLGMAGLWVGGGALGYPLTFVFGPVACVVSSMIVFPVLLLSALETGSFIVPFSRPVFRSLLTLPSGWLGFYMLISLLWGPLLLAGAWLFSYDPFLTIFFWSPLTAALTMITRGFWVDWRTALPRSRRPRIWTSRRTPRRSTRRRPASASDECASWCPSPALVQRTLDRPLRTNAKCHGSASITALSGHGEHPGGSAGAGFDLHRGDEQVKPRGGSLSNCARFSSP